MFYYHINIQIMFRDGSGIVLPTDVLQIQNIQKEAEFYSIQVIILIIQDYILILGIG